VKSKLAFLSMVVLSLAACVASPARPSPTPTPGSVALGEDVFTRVCAECHGTNAEGHAFPPAPALDGSEHAWHHPDVQIRDWIKNGKFGPVPTPALGDRVTEAEIDAVIAYIKSLWSEGQRSSQESINQRYPTPAP